MLFTYTDISADTRTHIVETFFTENCKGKKYFGSVHKWYLPLPETLTEEAPSIVGKTKDLAWGLFAYFLIEVVTFNHWAVWPVGTYIIWSNGSFWMPVCYAERCVPYIQKVTLIEKCVWSRKCVESWEVSLSVSQFKCVMHMILVY